MEVTGLQDYRYELAVTDSVTNIRNAASMGFPSVFGGTDKLSCSGDGCHDNAVNWILFGFYSADIFSLANPDDFTGVGPIDPGTLTFGIAHLESMTFIGDGESYVEIQGMSGDPGFNVWLTYHSRPWIG